MEPIHVFCSLFAHISMHTNVEACLLVLPFETTPKNKNHTHASLMPSRFKFGLFYKAGHIYIFRC